MDKNRLVTLKNSFDGIANAVAEVNIEYWMARDLMPLLGYSRWENFVEAIERTKTACSAQKIEISFHFRDVTKMAEIGIGKKRPIADIMLSRFACYLIAMNGDPAITDEHVTNNTVVRNMLRDRGIVPENLPPAPDIKKLERHVKKQDKTIATSQKTRLPESSEGVNN